ncbi:TPA: hypothetical protein N0F65_003565 [Lagenidium giganteum]|uniref:Gag-pol polyprotein n=1 Tax=Lagenidium giganteum TaxID=4803 RepID=A0AAV2Z2L4_9STRA|nr:TPA: hypothetical protein N0F65_003565 [Lagenidium giganteum]
MSGACGLSSRHDGLEHRRPGPSVQHARLTSTTSSDSRSLIIINLAVAGCDRPLRAPLDSGATNNFVRSNAVRTVADAQVTEFPSVAMVIRLANGEFVRTPKQVVRLRYGFDGFEVEDEFLAIAMDTKFDVIPGMPWLRRPRPVIDWLKLCRHQRGARTSGSDTLALAPRVCC